MKTNKYLEYINKIYKTRYFWSYLAKSDLMSRFRRSKLGLLWAVIQPLGLTMIFSFVFGTVFKQELGSYSIYILSGLVVWNLIQASIVGAGNCFISSGQYIRQYNHPITIYSLRYSILSIISFLLELIALVIWILFTHAENLVLGLVTLPLTLILYFPFVWGLSTIAGYMHTKYRDYVPIMTLFMQVLYYISPVFLKAELFSSNSILDIVIELNPITHIVNLLRNPFIYMRMPELKDYIYVIIVDIIITIWAVWLNNKNKNKIIFYL